LVILLLPEPLNRNESGRFGAFPDLVQAFLKKWWVESDFKAPNLPLSLRFKGSGKSNHIFQYTETSDIKYYILFNEISTTAMYIFFYA
jgi:hypothetical protein